MADPNVKTLADLPFHVAGRFPKPAILRRCQGAGVVDISGRDLLDQVRDLSLGFLELGLQPGDRVAIVSESRPEWSLTDLAVLAAGGVTVPIYPTLASGQVGHILQDSGATIVVASDAAQVAKVADVRGDCPELSSTVVIDAPPVLPADLHSLAAVADRGHRRLMTEDGEARRFKERAASVAPDGLATIIYTSGTTGAPKGVMLTHANLLSNIEACAKLLELTEEDVALSFLPLSHSFERMVVYLYLYCGVTVAFAETVETVARDMLQVRPTLMTGVPRAYEKIHARIHENVAQAPKLRQLIFRWALGVGRRRSKATLAGRSVPLLVRLQHGLADRLVFAKIRARTGGRIRLLVSGSAPLPKPIAEFFHAIGLTIIEGYGLTETSPVLTVNPVERPKFGTVGVAIDGVAIRIADDGEILAQGPNVMRGYYGKPEATREVIDEDGWFHTGDIGALDADGYLTITDRKKDLLVTSGGKNVAPQPIEISLKHHPLVAEAMLVGDRRRFVAALLVPDFPALERRLDELGRPAGGRDRLVEREDVRQLYQDAVDAVNAGLAQFETIKRFALIPTDFTIAGGELTPTLKIRRRVVEQRWSDAIDRLYAE